MLPVSNLFDSNCFRDPLKGTLFCLEPEENIRVVTSVCKSWRKVATEVVKIQLFWRAEDDLNQKLVHFFALTGETVADRFPCLSELWAEKNNLHVNELHKRLSALTQTVKYEVSCHKINFIEEDSFDAHFEKRQELVDGNTRIADLMALFNLSKKEARKKWKSIKDDLVLYNECIRGKEAICGTTFISFLHWVPFQHGCYPARLFCHRALNVPGLCFFPIELFNLKVQGKNHEVAGTLKDSYCIPVLGKLLELTISNDSRRPDKAAPLPFDWDLNLPQFYIPSLDAAAPTPETNNP